MSVAYKYNCLSKLVPAEMPQKLKKSTGIIEVREFGPICGSWSSFSNVSCLLSASAL